MTQFVAIPMALLADASAASSAMKSHIAPLMASMVGLAGVAVAFFLAYGGIMYMTSSGNPEKLEHAKRILRNALIGLVLVIAAASLTAILSHAYQSSAGGASQALPSVVPTPESTSNNTTDVLIRGVIGLLENFVKSAAKPFLDSLKFFTETTPLMADNSSVFNMWLVMVGIADVLFVVVVALIGFHIMSFATFGLDEIEFKHMLPQLGLIFLLINTSIFAIDAVIGLSNGIIAALRAGMPISSVWKTLTEVALGSGSMGLAALLIMSGLMILNVMLLVYYVLRLVVLYLGAVLSPVVFLLWLLPAFKDFAMAAMKVYITTIFVLFVHVVILGLAASIFNGMGAGKPGQSLNPIMSMVVGVATILALLKTQSVMSQLSYMSLGPKTARKLGGEVTNAVSHLSSHRKSRLQNEGNNNEGNSGRRTILGTESGSSRQTFGRSSTVAIPRDSQYSSRRDWPAPNSTVIHARPLQTGQTRRSKDMGDI